LPVKGFMQTGGIETISSEEKTWQALNSKRKYQQTA